MTASVSTDAAAPALSAALAEVRAELARTDNKAATLLGLVGAGLAVVVGVGSARHLPAVSTAAMWASAACLTAAVTALLLVVRPVHGGGSRGSLWHYAAADPADLAAAFTGPTPPGQDTERLARLSGIAADKYACIRRSVDLMLLALALLALAVLAAG